MSKMKYAYLLVPMLIVFSACSAGSDEPKPSEPKVSTNKSKEADASNKRGDEKHLVSMERRRFLKDILATLGAQEGRHYYLEGTNLALPANPGIYIDNYPQLVRYIELMTTYTLSVESNRYSSTRIKKVRVVKRDKTRGYVSKNFISVDGEIGKVSKTKHKSFSVKTKSARFGDILNMISRQTKFNYSIADDAYLGMMPGEKDVKIETSNTNETGGEEKDVKIADIAMAFSYSGNSLQEMMTLLCESADLYCHKAENDLWKIEKYQTFIVDKAVYFNYSIGTGSGGGGESGGDAGSSGGEASGGMATSSGGGAAGDSSSSGGDSDTFSFSEQYNSFVTLIKPFLTDDGKVYHSPRGYIVIQDRPSGINRIERIVNKETGKEEAIDLQVEVVRIDLKNEYQSGVNWNAVLDGLTVSGDFTGLMQGGGFNFTLNKGKGTGSLVSLLGDYGDVYVVKSWNVKSRSGYPSTFKVTESIPYFTQSSLVSTSATEVATAVSYKDVGLFIKVLLDHEGDLVKGGVYAKNSELIEMVDNGDGVTAPKTSLTEVSAAVDIDFDEQMVLTGFVTKNNTKKSSGLPWFVELPVVGTFFGYKQKISDVSENVIIVTPRMSL